MNLDIKPQYFCSLIKESLNIENFEYSYFIPILAQTAEYWGDTEVVSTCNIMSRQLKQYLSHTAFVLFSTYKKEQLSEKSNYYLTKLNNYKEINSKEIDNLNIYDLANRYNIVKLENTLFFHENSKNIQLNSLLNKLHGIDNNLFRTFPTLKKEFYKKKESKIFSQIIDKENSRFLHKNHSIFLLKNLHYRKFLKANRWYPALSKISYKEGMTNLSQNFFEMAKSEEKISNLLIRLIER